MVKEKPSHSGSLWEEQSCSYSVPQDEDLAKRIIASVTAQGIAEITLRVTAEQKADSGKLRNLKLRGIQKVLDTICKEELVSFNFDKLGVCVTFTGKDFSVNALHLFRMKHFEGIEVTSTFLIQQYTKRLLLFDIDEDFSAEEVAKRLRIKGGVCAIKEVYRQSVRETFPYVESTPAYQGYGVFVTYIGFASPEKVFLGSASLRCRILFPRPLQCRKCLHYGHSERGCNPTVYHCGKCAGQHNTKYHQKAVDHIEINNIGRDSADVVPSPPKRCLRCVEKKLTPNDHGSTIEAVPNSKKTRNFSVQHT